jgi:hypothetical protein
VCLRVRGSENSPLVRRKRYWVRDPGVCAYVCICVNVCVCMRVCVFGRVYMYACMFIHSLVEKKNDAERVILVCMCTYVCVYACTHTHTHIYEP